MANVWDVIPNDVLDERLLTGVSALIQTSFPLAHSRVVSPDDLVWKLGSSNPAGRGFMTVAVAEDEVVGVMTATRKRFWLRGAELAVAEVGDVFTKAEYLRSGRARLSWPGDESGTAYLSRSIFGRLVTESLNRADAAGVSFYFGVANDAALPGWTKRLGFSRWEGNPVSTYSRLMAAGVGKRVPRLAWAVPALRMVDRFQFGMYRFGSQIAGRISVREINSHDELDSIEDLWQRTRGNVPFGPLRDAAYFSHRFMEHPTAFYRIFIVAKRGADVAAFVMRQAADSAGSEMAYLVDYLADSNDLHILGELFSQLLLRIDNHDVLLASAWTQDVWPAHSRLLLGVMKTYTPRLIVKGNAMHPIDLDGFSSMGITIGATDNG